MLPELFENACDFKFCPKLKPLVQNRGPVAQWLEHRAVTREVASSTPAGPTLRILK